MKTQPKKIYIISNKKHKFIKAQLFVFHKMFSNIYLLCFRSLFVAELVTSDHVGSMIEGQYSNYVLQKMMDTAPHEVMPALMEVLR